MGSNSASGFCQAHAAFFAHLGAHRIWGLSLDCLEIDFECGRIRPRPSSQRSSPAWRQTVRRTTPSMLVISRREAYCLDHSCGGRQADLGADRYRSFHSSSCCAKSIKATLSHMSIPSIRTSLLLGPCAVSKSILEAAGALTNRSKTSRITTMSANGANGVNRTRSHHDFSSLKVNQSRLMDAIHTGCKYGAAHRYGEYVLHPGIFPALTKY